MDESDYMTFEKAFGRLCAAFRLRFVKGEQAELTRTYFKVLDRFRLDDVLQRGRHLLETQKRFPTLADWIAALGGMSENTPVIDVRQMTASELAVQTQAETLRYTDDPCACRECSAANVTDRQLRFVPTLLYDGDEERAWHPLRKRVEIVGHWAHGEELRRWYAAQDHFRQQFGTYRAKQVIAMAMAAKTRQPGEDD